jgi:AcrR family transcriptional regulator
MSRAGTKRTGRRPGATDTREQIAVAARTLFAELGYERATFRAIAGAAHVDPALVVHFYGTKDELFRQVMALPPPIAEGLAGLAEGPRETVGRRLAELIVGALEHPASRTVVLGRIRCASSHPDAALSSARRSRATCSGSRRRCRTTTPRRGPCSSARRSSGWRSRATSCGSSPLRR